MTIYLAGRDEHRIWTLLALGGLAAGGLIAVFGLPPIPLHGPTHHLGLMSATCGMTRAVRHLALGNIDHALAYNPASLLLAPAGIVLALRAAIGTLTGRWVSLRVNLRRRGWSVVAVLVGLLWLHQQSNADYLA